MQTFSMGISLFSLDSEKTIESISDTLSSINETLTNMVGILTQDPSTMPELWSIVNSAITISQTIALVLVVLYWLTNFVFTIGDMDWRNVSIWWYFREIIKLVLAKALIDIAPELCTTIFQFGAWCMNKYMSVGILSGDIFNNIDYLNLKTSLDNMSFMEHTFFRIDLMLPRFIMWISNIVIMALAYFRLLQVCLMSIIAPIPLATFTTGSRHGAALNFVKEYVSVVGQAAIIILAMLIYKGIVNYLIAGQIGDFQGIMRLCMSTIVLTITIFSSQRLAKMFLGH